VIVGGNRIKKSFLAQAPYSNIIYQKSLLIKHNCISLTWLWQ